MSKLNIKLLITSQLSTVHLSPSVNRDAHEGRGGLCTGTYLGGGGLRLSPPPLRWGPAVLIFNEEKLYAKFSTLLKMYA